MPDPRGKHAASPLAVKVPAQEPTLDTKYEDPFWADLAARINFAGRIKEGALRIPRRDARKFWHDLERTFFSNPRPRGA